MRPMVKITKALADRNRLLILFALSEAEMCVCYLVEWLGMAPSTVSKHLSILENAELVEVRREGRWAYYRLAKRGKNRYLATLFGWLLPALKAEMSPKELTRLAGIRKRSMEDV